MQEILAGEGAQELSFTPDYPVDAGTTPTWSLENLHEEVGGNGRVLASGNAAVDALSLPLLHEVGARLPEPRTLQVTGSSLVVGEAYLLEGESGAERVFIASKGLTQAELVTPVRGYYASGSTLRGLRLTADVPESVAADEDFARDETAMMLVWRFQVNGSPRIVTELARVVRGGSTGRYNVEVEREIVGSWDELARSVHRHATSVPRIIRYAERRVRARLEAHSIPADQFFAGPQGFDILVARALLHFAQMGIYPKSRDPEVFVQERREEYVMLWNDLTIGGAGRNVTETNSEQRTTEAHTTKRRSPFSRA